MWLVMVSVSCAPRPTVGQGRDMERMLDDLQAGLGLTDDERALLTPELGRSELLGGSVGHARNAIWVAVDRTCRGSCLVDLVRVWNSGLAEGWGEAPAADRALAAIERPPARIVHWEPDVWHR